MKEHRVALVVDRTFGDRLLVLASRMHVWACGSLANRRAAESFRAKSPEPSVDHGITVFTDDEHDRPEQRVIRTLFEVDLHHGEASHDPPWTTLEVFGADAAPDVEQALRGHGVTRIERTDSGFIAMREEVTDHRARSPRPGAPTSP